jgi:nickel-dependent lactate racemase
MLGAENMTRKIEVPQLPWHDPKPLALTFPDSWQIEVCNFAGWDRPALDAEGIKAAIANPIGMPPIREAAKGKKEVVIIFDDLARPTRASKIVPHVLNELAQAGIPDNRIRFVASYGGHGMMTRAMFAKKLGDDIVARYPVYNHNIYENCTSVGTTSNGTPVSINAEFAHCDFKISINVNCPHHLVGFSGGGKMIIPGIASKETIVANHTMLADKLGYRGGTDSAITTPAYKDMEEAADLAGLDVNIECLVNEYGETVSLYAGALRPAHEAALEEASSHYLTPKAKDKDIVVANTYAKVTEWGLGMKAAESVNSSGGDYVLIANSPDGIVPHFLSLAWGTTIGGVFWKMRSGGREIPPHFNRLIVYSEYPEEAAMRWFEDSPKLSLMTSWDEVLLTLQEGHGKEATVAVYPSTELAYFA